MPKKRLTNVEFISELMEFSSAGPLMQSFVFAALENYSNQIIKASSDDWDTNGFISFESWQATAKEVLSEIDKRFNDDK